MPEILDLADAVLLAWYPGEEGGTALANILFGEVNPSGKLPVTFYKSVNDLPPFDDYSMDNRTYRYFKGEPEFEFGYGLSYTTFDFMQVTMDKEEATMNDTINLTVTIKNTGNYDGDEVIQVYGSKVEPMLFRPIKTLTGFKRVSLKKGETKQVTIPLDVRQLAWWDVKNQHYVVEPGTYRIEIGTSSKNIRVTREIRVKQ
jgi:beta-glucosidase